MVNPKKAYSVIEEGCDKEEEDEEEQGKEEEEEEEEPTPPDRKERDNDNTRCSVGSVLAPRHTRVIMRSASYMDESYKRRHCPSCAVMIICLRVPEANVLLRLTQPPSPVVAVSESTMRASGLHGSQFCGKHEGVMF